MALLLSSGSLILLFQNCSSSGFNNNKIYATDGSSKIYFSDSALQAQSVTVLQTNCASCHGSNATGGLAGITNVEHLIANKYITPGKATASLLIQAIENGSMPPGKTLASNEVDTLKAWINSFTTSTPPENPTDPNVIPLRATFTSIKANILSRCVSCHTPAGERSQTDFSSYNSLMVSGTVVAGNPNTSSLYQRTFDYSMPKVGDKLSYAEFAVLKTWIQSGAPND